MFVVVSYDIPDNSRRNHVHTILKNYGTPVQESVFECDLDPRDIDKMEKKLLKTLELDEDKARFYFLCEACLGRVKILGEGRLSTSQDFYIT